MTLQAERRIQEHDTNLQCGANNNRATTKDCFQLMIFLINLSVICAMKCQKMVRNVEVDVLKCLVLSATQRRLKKRENIPI